MERIAGVGRGRPPGKRPRAWLIERLAKEAEEGFDVDEMLKNRVGRPPMGSAASSVESVRLDPELSQALRSRAERDEETSSAVIRRALRAYLQTG